MKEWIPAPGDIARVGDKRPTGFTIARWSIYKGFRIKIVERSKHDPDTYLVELLDGPLMGENRWLKRKEFERIEEVQDAGIL